MRMRRPVARADPAHLPQHVGGDALESASEKRVGRLEGHELGAPESANDRRRTRRHKAPKRMAQLRVSVGIDAARSWNEEAYSLDELRVTHTQNIVLPHVKQSDLYALWQKLDAAGLATANLDLIGDIIACPGLDYCSLANARSIPIAQKIAAKFEDSVSEQRDIGELKIKVSGCINGCGHHHAGHIGILGVDKKGEEAYQLLLGGSGAEDASLAKILGPGFDENGIIEAVDKLIAFYRTARTQPSERFLDTYRRLGPAPFKEAVYGG